MPTLLYSVAIDARRSSCSDNTFASLFAALIVDVLEVEGVEMAWKNTAQSCISYCCDHVWYEDNCLQDRPTPGNKVEWGTYPSNVRQMFIRRSAPHPATHHAPSGGTFDHNQCLFPDCGGSVLTYNGDDHQEDCRDYSHICYYSFDVYGWFISVSIFIRMIWRIRRMLIDWSCLGEEGDLGEWVVLESYLPQRLERDAFSLASAPANDVRFPS